MKAVKNKIPYSGNCPRKTRKEGISNGVYHCDVLADTSMKCLASSDSDGIRCLQTD